LTFLYTVLAVWAARPPARNQKRITMWDVWYLVKNKVTVWVAWYLARNKVAERVVLTVHKTVRLSQNWMATM
jgi:hypothetical protein